MHHLFRYEHVWLTWHCDKRLIKCGFTLLKKTTSAWGKLISCKSGCMTNLTKTRKATSASFGKQVQCLMSCSLPAWVCHQPALSPPAEPEIPSCNTLLSLVIERKVTKEKTEDHTFGICSVEKTLVVSKCLLFPSFFLKPGIHEQNGCC